jgi:hypothetical protein
MFSIALRILLISLSDGFAGRPLIVPFFPALPL